MSHIINITDKLQSSKPRLQIGEKSYEVNNSMRTMMRFEELIAGGQKESIDSLLEAVKLTLGEEFLHDHPVEDLSFADFQVFITAIIATIQGVSYEEAEGRFRK